MAVMDKVYLYPVAGSAPTAAQMTRVNEKIFNLVTEAGAKEDNTPVVHSLNLAPADGSDGRPEVQITKLASGTVLTDISVAFTDKDTVTFTKIIKGANTGATFRVVVRRPTSLSR